MGAIMVAEMVGYTDDGMTLDEAIAAYLAACDVEGKSPRTVDAYAETLGHVPQLLPTPAPRSFLISTTSGIVSAQVRGDRAVFDSLLCWDGWMFAANHLPRQSDHPVAVRP